MAAQRDRADHQVDVAVVGAGAAGLYASLCAAGDGAKVALISATPLAQTASYWAQGGLAAALSQQDSFELHLRDTEHAGRGAVRHSAALVLVHEAPERVRDLQTLGVVFDADSDGDLVLSLEGGHSVRRVVHAGGSATGRRVVRQLSALAAENPRIQVLEGTRAAKLWMVDGVCRGLACADGRVVRARAVLIATGGAAALWARTTNPPGSLGSGLMLALHAGAALADLEFLQFHPTAVTGVPGREGFLVTEAIRGEGARLLDEHGERFVDELAPRDEVARAIWTVLERSGARAVSLDMRDIDPTRFPNIFSALADSGLDATRQLVPVSPAAHYMMGGIVTDLHGRSELPGLYAVGESACTGLHGANRLASNSLSECFVFGRRAARRALDEPALPAAQPGHLKELARAAPPATIEQATRQALWDHAGIERSAEGLRQLLQDPFPLARLIAACALARNESRGAHFRVESARCDAALDQMHAVVGLGGQPSLQRWS